ncbi:MAG TPA: hypothetical protein VJA21_16840 [Verrucomicrobiae bacterium]
MPSILELGPVCRDAQRRADILAHPVLNGIDFVEYERRPVPAHPHVLVVHFLKPLPNPPHSNPDGAYGLTQPAGMGRILIQGGTRIVNIRPIPGAVTLAGSTLEIPVTEEGDFSTYVLALGWALQPDGSFQQEIAALDPQFSIHPVNFKAGCPTDFDCRALKICPPKDAAEPLIDYLAKDYASFRRLLIDLIPQLNPGWLERNPSDLGIALLELLAYEGDQLSYFQDAVANEAYLDTARQRPSAKKHARLVDYAMHDGRNAWAFVCVAAGSGGTIPQGTKILSRVTAPLRSKSLPPDVVIPEAEIPSAAFDSDPALARVRVFETAFPLPVHPENNEIYLHTWGNLECCLPTGTQIAYLYSLAAGPGERQASRPTLAAGDFLLLEEVMGPKTGAEADADPTHRQVVQLEGTPQNTEDSAYRHMLTADVKLQLFRPGDTPLPLLRVTWRRVDALRFPLCLSSRIPGRDPLLNVSVARGNIVLADHGRTIAESFEPKTPVSADKLFRFRLREGPMTMQCQPDTVHYDENPASPTFGRIVTPRIDLTCQVRMAKPAVALSISFPGVPPQLWTPVPDLISSPGTERHFTAEVENDGRPTIRFGDDEYGQRPAGATAFTAIYRIGNGRAGNVGAESLAHAVQPLIAPGWPAIAKVRNPLPAQDGTDVETIEEVRQFAPAAFRAEQFRAVVEADYSAAAKKLPEVAGAVASFRWTGSWYTVFVGVDPRNPDDLITEPGGRTRLEPDFRARVLNFLTTYKLAGYDLEIRSAEYVPIELAFELCVQPDHFRGDVVEAVRQALSNRINADGRKGFFHPDNFTFAQNVYLSTIYAAIEAVQGVRSAFVTIFRRFGKSDNGELASGVLTIGPWEIARLDNDPAFQENGVLRITPGGGK